MKKLLLEVLIPDGFTLKIDLVPERGLTAAPPAGTVSQSARQDSLPAAQGTPPTAPSPTANAPQSGTSALGRLAAPLAGEGYTPAELDDIAKFGRPVVHYPAPPGVKVARIDSMRPPSTMRPSDFHRFTEEGRETLARILRRTLERNGRRPRDHATNRVPAPVELEAPPAQPEGT